MIKLTQGRELTREREGDRIAGVRRVGTELSSDAACVRGCRCFAFPPKARDRGPGQAAFSLPDISS